MKISLQRAAYSLIIFLIGSVAGFFVNTQMQERAHQARSMILTMEAQKALQSGGNVGALDAALIAFAQNPSGYSNNEILADTLSKCEQPDFAIHMYDRAFNLVIDGSTSSGIVLTDAQKQFEQQRIQKKRSALATNSGKKIF